MSGIVTEFAIAGEPAPLLRQMSAAGSVDWYRLEERKIKGRVVFSIVARPSDSPFVEQIWRAGSEDAGAFYSLAASHWEMVVTMRAGAPTFTVRGPATRATLLHYPTDREWIGIRFKPGTFLSAFPTGELVDGAVDLPTVGRRGFSFLGSTWQIPDFENADTFVDQLARGGLIRHDPVVVAALAGERSDVSPRTLERRFLHATGLTQTMIRQIHRARQAMDLLRQGTSILDTVHETGYYDQAHLTRALKRWLGQTPAQIVAASRRP